LCATVVAELLQQSGEVRVCRSLGKGRIVAADGTMSPSVRFSQNTSGMGDVGP
jgi:hypothetical protein